jgi:hypothetical protein
MEVAPCSTPTESQKQDPQLPWSEGHRHGTLSKCATHEEEQLTAMGPWPPLSPPFLSLLWCQVLERHHQSHKDLWNQPDTQESGLHVGVHSSPGVLWEAVTQQPWEGCHVPSYVLRNCSELTDGDTGLQGGLFSMKLGENRTCGLDLGILSQGLCSVGLSFPTCSVGWLLKPPSSQAQSAISYCPPWAWQSLRLSWPCLLLASAALANCPHC